MQLDPEGTELTALLACTGDLSGRRVLEVGCGDGRLVWRYARQASYVLGLDPDPERIAQAEAARPPELAGRVAFRVAGLPGEPPPAAPAEKFDVALLGWSL